MCLWQIRAHSHIHRTAQPDIALDLRNNTAEVSSILAMPLFEQEFTNRPVFVALPLLHACKPFPDINHRSTLTQVPDLSSDLWYRVIQWDPAELLRGCKCGCAPRTRSFGTTSLTLSKICAHSIRITPVGHAGRRTCLHAIRECSAGSARDQIHHCWSFGSDALPVP